MCMISLLSDFIYDLLAKRLDTADDFSSKPFTQPGLISAHVKSVWPVWTHYGLMIPGLPAPFNFLDALVFIGRAGITAFEDPADVVQSDSNTVSLLCASAAMKNQLHEFYSLKDDCHVAPEGTNFNLGDKLTIKGKYPNFTVNINHEDFNAQLSIKSSSTVTWFNRIPFFYDHLSLLSEYQGTISQGKKVATVSGLCCFEYAAAGPFGSLGSALNMPINFFNYEIINLDNGYQLLIGRIYSKDKPVKTRAYLRSLQSKPVLYKSLSYECIESQSKESSAGKKMIVPIRWRWKISQGGLPIDLEAKIQTDYYYGLGLGYTAGYDCNGTIGDQKIKGAGYIEYIDVQ
jgi:hypothetical protein